MSVLLHVLLVGWWLGLWTAPPPAPLPLPEEARIQLALLPPAAPPMPVELRQHPIPTPQRAAQGAPAPPAEQAPPIPRPLAELPLLRAAPPTLAPMHQDLAVARHADALAQAATEAAAPPTPSVPPGPQAVGARDPNWEGQVLARLEKFRRYPRQAQVRRMQGVVYVRARIGRGGQVQAARVQRSSGSELLDGEALATFQRAQPLPAPPETLPDPVELEVPVEFFLR